MTVLDPVAEALASCSTLALSTIEALFVRYGRPLEDEHPMLDPTIEVGVLRVGRLRYRSPVDVIANDHFVLLRGSGPPLAMPGMLFAAAVAALSKKASAE